MTTSIVTSFVAPNLTRVAVVRFQGRDFTVRQTPKLTTTVWLGSARVAKKDHPLAFHTVVGAAFAEWESPAEETPAAVTETVEDRGGPAPVVVTREYDAPPVASGEVLPYRLTEEGDGRWLVFDRQTTELWGTVRRAEESMRPGQVQWTRWVAYGPDGSRVGHTDSLPGAARLLVPLSDQAQETLADSGYGRAHGVVADRTLAEREAALPCWHVTTARGHVYGVAATTRTDALSMTQARLTGEGSGDRPVKAERVATWVADYGTVLCYS